MGILLEPRPEYAAKKAALTPGKQASLDLAEEAIAADPDRARLVVDAISYDFFDDFVAVAFRRLGPGHGELVQFTFYEDG